MLEKLLILGTLAYWPFLIVMCFVFPPVGLALLAAHFYNQYCRRIHQAEQRIRELEQERTY